MKNNSGKCLVLGANGFIGSYIVDSLVQSGFQVRAFGKFKNRKINFSPTDNIEIFQGNFLNRSDLDSALQGVDYVFHFISTTTPASSDNDPIIDIETNVKMSVELFELCAKNQIKKLIFASTGGSIYGEKSSETISENELPEPVSPYAIGKLTIENYLRYFNRKDGLESVIYRISNPYGPRQSSVNKQGVIPIFIDNLINNKELNVYGDGSMVRDYIFVEDAVDMITGSFDKAKQHLYNIGSGQGTNILDLIKILEKVSSKKAQLNFKPKPESFVQKSILNTERFLEEFNIKPKISLEEGLRRTYLFNTK